jgi:hypothetical protein
VQPLCGQIRISIEGSPERVVCVGADQRTSFGKAYYHQRMVVGFSVVELNQIAGLQAGETYGNCCRTKAFILCQKAMQIGCSGPGRSPVSGGIVVPADILGIVHRAASGTKTLGGKVGTVTSEGVKIQIGGVPGEGPFFRIGYGCLTVVLIHIGQFLFDLFYAHCNISNEE